MTRPNVPFTALTAALVLGGYHLDAAAIVALPAYSSHVTDVVNDNGNGTWTYNFTVFNDTTANAYGGTPVIVDWELPYFSDAGIVNITSAVNWNFAIETVGVANTNTGWDGVAAWQDPTDALFQGPTSPYTTATQVLHWYTGPTRLERPFNPILPENSLGGFSFTAGFAPTGAPYQASWDIVPRRTGDPAFPTAGIPNSPSVAVVPLPGALALLASGLFGLGGVKRRKA